MRQMTVSEIQKINLDIMRDIKNFCQKRGIRFHLAYGTLLGAIRHHGFIPWDDDADIGMLRPDYDRFIKEYQDGGKYKLFAPERGNTFMNTARLCEMEDTSFQHRFRWTLESTGVGLDIVPVDVVPDSRSEYLDFAACLVQVRDELLARRMSYAPQTFRKDPIGFAKDVVHYGNRMWQRLANRILIPRLLSKDMAMRTRYRCATSKHCSQIQGHHYPCKFWERSWFGDEIWVEFEDDCFPVPVGYHELLSAEYDEYMIPSPPDSRVGHSRIQTMYWRNK